MTMRYEPELVSEGCEPARIGRALGVALAREHELDLASIADAGTEGATEAHRDAQALHVYDQTQAMRWALTCHRAKSLEGCLYQVAETLCRLDSRDKMGKDADSYEGQQDYRAAVRCLYSIMGYLEGLSALRLADMPRTDCLMPESLNPWIRVEDRVQAIAARDAGARP